MPWEHERSWRQWFERWRIRTQQRRPRLEETVQPVVVIDDWADAVLGPVLPIYGVFANIAAVALELTYVYITAGRKPLILLNLLTDTATVDYGLLATADPIPALTQLTPQQVQGSSIEASTATVRAGTSLTDLLGTGPTPRMRVDVLTHPGFIVLPGQTFVMQTFTVNQGLVCERMDWVELDDDEPTSVQLADQ